VTNDELPDHRRPGGKPATMDNMAGDVSDDLYSEISSRDTEQLLKSRVSSKARRAAASTSKLIVFVVNNNNNNNNTSSDKAL